MERVAGKAEAAQARFERPALTAGVGVDPRARRFIEQGFGKGGAARFRLRQIFLLRHKPFAQGVEFFIGGAGGGAGVGGAMRAVLRRLLRQRAVKRRQGAIEGGAKGALRFVREFVGAQLHHRRGVGRGETIGQPIEGAGLASARGAEQTDGERRRRVGAAQEFGEAAQQHQQLRRAGESGGRGGRVGLERRRRGRGGGGGRRARRRLIAAPGQNRFKPPRGAGGKEIGWTIFVVGQIRAPGGRDVIFTRVAMEGAS